ncbi:hypothetical protein [Maribellus sp. YY47]|uniref:hypothetical protein n=1 Tax=Maribellus sp. YY47 TaxID=2929486 RepID=UPI0020007FAB|nr:hypothetical protein [Maribellus sp. YY47]MCK3682727.1 hypothetical protein [Maribellus sp. YY47]
MFDLRYLFTVSFLFLLVFAKAQAPADENSFAINGWTSFSKDDNHFGVIELAHEWKPIPYLGFDLGGGFGWLGGNDLQTTSVASGSNLKLYSREINGSFQLARAKITAYLPLWRDDDYVTRIQGFVAVKGGLVSAISTVGKLEFFETNQAVEASSENKGHFFHGFEFGVWGNFSNHWAMKLYLGNSNIPFGDAVKELNAEVGNFPIHFDSSITNAYVGFSLIYTYRLRRKTQL